MAFRPKNTKRKFIEAATFQTPPRNTLLREFSAGDERITLVSINDKLADNGVLRPELYGDKCCHPNADGYRIWGEAIEPYVKEILAPRN